MRLSIELQSPFTWDDLIAFIHLISDDLSDFEVSRVRIVGSSIVAELVEPATQDKEAVDTEEQLGGCDHKAQEVVTTADHATDVKADDLTWIQYNDGLEYAVNEKRNLLWIRKRSSFGYVQWSRRLPFSKVKELFDRLPDRAMSNDVVRVAQEVGLNIPASYVTILMKILGNYAAFDAKLVRETIDGSSRYVLVKGEEEGFLREETRRKLQQEREVIGDMEVRA